MKMTKVCRNSSYAKINLDSVHHSLNNLQKTLVRLVEKLLKRQVQSEYGMLFNETCINENIYIFTQMYMHAYMYLKLCHNPAENKTLVSSNVSEPTATN